MERYKGRFDVNDISKTIGWADKSWNVLTGCYGPGGSAEHPAVCSYCYAAQIAHRFAGSKAFPNVYALPPGVERRQEQPQ